jgi:hypothetical protein
VESKALLARYAALGRIAGCKSASPRRIPGRRAEPMMEIA